jgi:hypothetical protein
MEETINNITTSNKEKLQKLKEKLNKIKENIYKILANSDENNRKFFDEIFNIQNEVLSSEDIREAKLEKEFNQILKILNLLHSIQDNKIKTTKTELLSLLQDYLDTKEKMIELTETNCNTLELFKNALFEIKEEINNIKNNRNKVSNVTIAFFNAISKSFKNPIIQRISGYLFLLFMMIMFLYFVKHLDQGLYNDTKDIIKQSITKTQGVILNQNANQNSNQNSGSQTYTYPSTP